MILREMLVDDLDQVMEIEQDLFHVPWTKEGFFTFLTRDDAMFLVVEEKEKILGYCGLLMVLDEGDITNVAVRRDRQKEGIGAFLMQSLIRLAAEREVTTIHLEVRVGNGSVCVTKYAAAPEVEAFEKRLNSLGIRTFRHYKIPGYPNDVARIVSDEGYGKNDYIETQRPLVVITAPGPGSGKMATCLSQLYHEYKRGVKAGYAKFETFPIWNIPLKHPVNLAYEAATADLNDVNMIDPFHLEAYGVTTVNYNRDIEIFPVVNAMFELIAGKSPYKSPTDMGVNMAGNCIVDDAVCREASRKEILRRYFKCLCEQKITGTVKETERYKLELLMNQADLTVGQREVEKQAHARSESTGGAPAAAIELPDGTVVTGKTGPLLGAAASALMNALKVLAGIPQETDLVSAASIEPIQTLKTNYLGGKNPRLHTDEILIALSSSAASNEQAAAAMHQLPNLKGCDVHSTVLLSGVDTSTLNRLGMYLTCDPVYEEEDRKYHKQ